MDAHPLVSVILPFYNRENVLRRAIDSVVKQSYEKIELILVDDGSKDASAELAAEYESESVILIRMEENLGACHARNVGLKQATGDYVAFLDSDNEWDRDFILDRLITIERGRHDFVFGRYEVIEENGEKIQWPALERKDIENHSFSRKYTFKQNLIDTNTILLTSGCRERIGFFDENLKRFQDWEYFGRLFMLENISYGFIEDVHVHGYYQKNSISKVVGFWDARIELMNKQLSDIYKFNEVIEVVNHLTYIMGDCEISDKQKKRVYGILRDEDVAEIFKRSVSADRFYNCVKKHKRWFFEEKQFNFGDKIIVYGYGEVGKDFAYQILYSDRLKLVGIADKKYDGQGKDGFIDTSAIIDSKFDYLIIAILEKSVSAEVKRNLLHLGVPEKKIIWFDFWD